MIDNLLVDLEGLDGMLEDDSLVKAFREMEEKDAARLKSFRYKLGSWIVRLGTKIQPPE